MESEDVKDSQPELSKRAQKRLAKRARNHEKSIYHKQQYKKRQKIRVEEFRQQRQKLLESGDVVAASNLKPVRGSRRSRAVREERKKRLRESLINGQRVIIDLSFIDMMSRKEKVSLANQIRISYGLNRNALTPLHLILSSFNTEGEAILAKQDGAAEWLIDYQPSHFADAYNKADCIYLTAESANVLEEMTSDMIYVIGGLVDHNRLKAVCHDSARKLNIKTARLPILKYMTHTGAHTRLIITVDQVFLILLTYIQFQSWRIALHKCMPGRKGYILKEPLNELELEKINQYDASVNKFSSSASTTTSSVLSPSLSSVSSSVLSSTTTSSVLSPSLSSVSSSVLSSTTTS